MIDNRDDESFGFRVNKWEVKGAPLIFKIGAKEHSQKVVLIKRRDSGEEVVVAQDELRAKTEDLLGDIQGCMFEASQKFISESTREARTYEEFKQIAADHKGFIKVCWNDDPEVEKKIKEETKFKTSCRPIDWPELENGVDFFTGKPAKQQWLFAQSY